MSTAVYYVVDSDGDPAHDGFGAAVIHTDLAEAERHAAGLNRIVPGFGWHVVEGEVVEEGAP